MGFVVEGVDTKDGSRATLNESYTSGEALAFLAGYVRTENAGNWDLIEVYDVRGVEAERIHFWEREPD